MISKYYSKGYINDPVWYIKDGRGYGNLIMDNEALCNVVATILVFIAIPYIFDIVWCAFYRGDKDTFNTGEMVEKHIYDNLGSLFEFLKIIRRRPLVDIDDGKRTPGNYVNYKYMIRPVVIYVLILLIEVMMITFSQQKKVIEDINSTMYPKLRQKLKYSEMREEGLINQGIMWTSQSTCDYIRAKVPSNVESNMVIRKCVVMSEMPSNISEPGEEIFVTYDDDGIFIGMHGDNLLHFAKITSTIELTSEQRTVSYNMSRLVSKENIKNALEYTSKVMSYMSTIVERKRLTNYSRISSFYDIGRQTVVNRNGKVKMRREQRLSAILYMSVYIYESLYITNGGYKEGDLLYRDDKDGKIVVNKEAKVASISRATIDIVTLVIIIVIIATLSTIIRLSTERKSGVFEVFFIKMFQMSKKSCTTAVLEIEHKDYRVVKSVKNYDYVGHIGLNIPFGFREVGRFDKAITVSDNGADKYNSKNDMTKLGEIPNNNSIKNYTGNGALHNNVMCKSISEITDCNGTGAEELEEYKVNESKRHVSQTGMNKIVFKVNSAYFGKINNLSTQTPNKLASQNESAQSSNLVVGKVLRAARVRESNGKDDKENKRKESRRSDKDGNVMLCASKSHQINNPSNRRVIETVAKVNQKLISNGVEYTDSHIDGKKYNQLVKYHEGHNGNDQVSKNKNNRDVSDDKTVLHNVARDEVIGNREIPKQRSVGFEQTSINKCNKHGRYTDSLVNDKKYNQLVEYQEGYNGNDRGSKNDRNVSNNETELYNIVGDEVIGNREIPKQKSVRFEHTSINKCNKHGPTRDNGYELLIKNSKQKLKEYEEDKGNYEERADAKKQTNGKSTKLGDKISETSRKNLWNECTRRRTGKINNQKDDINKFNERNIKNKSQTMNNKRNRCRNYSLNGYSNEIERSKKVCTGIKQIKTSNHFGVLEDELDLCDDGTNKSLRSGKNRKNDKKSINILNANICNKNQGDKHNERSVGGTKLIGGNENNTWKPNKDPIEYKEDSKYYQESRNKVLIIDNRLVSTLVIIISMVIVIIKATFQIKRGRARNSVSRRKTNLIARHVSIGQDALLRLDIVGGKGKITYNTNVIIKQCSEDVLKRDKLRGIKGEYGSSSIKDVMRIRYSTKFYKKSRHVQKLHGRKKKDKINKVRLTFKTF